MRADGRARNGASILPRAGPLAAAGPAGLKAAMLRRLALLADRRPRLLLVLYCLLCWLPGWFTIPATDRDESRFAQATKQMIETGDFIDIRNGTEARNRKPIGIYWLQAAPAAAARAAGIAQDNPIWPYRLPSLLGALAGVLATYAIGRRLFDPRAALLAGCMLGGSALLTVEAHLAKTDAALLGATTLAMAVLARAYLAPSRLRAGQAALFWLAVGAGVLLKGPITPMVAGLAALSLVAADREGRWLAALRPAWGVALMLAVVLPWLAAIEFATHGQFLSQSVGGDLGRKLAGGDDAHGAPPGYYLLLVSLTLFPAGFAALRALPDAWAARRDPATRFLLAWAIPSWLVFEAVPTKLPHYVLPLYPALCLIAAPWVLAGGRTRWRWLALVSGALFVLAGLVFGGGAIALPIVTGARLAVALAWGLPALLAAALVVGLVLRAGRDTRRAVWSGLLAAPLLWWAILAFELPNLPALWVSARVAAWVQRHPASGFAAVGYAEPSLMFSAGTGTRWLGPQAAARFLAEDSGRLVAVAERDVARFLIATGEPAPRAIATVRGFDYSTGRRVALTLFEGRVSGVASGAASMRKSE